MVLDRSPESFSPQMNSTFFVPFVPTCLPVSEKKNFEVSFLCSYVPTCDPLSGASFDPQDMI